MSKLKILTKGLIKENPILKLLLGMCPTLAVTTTAENGIGMGLATAVVLIGSNTVIAILRKIIPGKVRIPAFITIIAGFVTIIQFFLKAYLPVLNKNLGIFIPLIVVNCIILARAEMFASKHKVLDSVLDGIGMGAGFTFALFLIGSIREILGNGTWFDINLTKDLFDPAIIMVLPPGGFLIFGIIMAVISAITKKKIEQKHCGACEFGRKEEEKTKEAGE